MESKDNEKVDGETKRKDGKQVNMKKGEKTKKKRGKKKNRG